MLLAINQHKSLLAMQEHVLKIVLDIVVLLFKPPQSFRENAFHTTLI